MMDRTWIVHVLILLCLVHQITATTVANQSLVGCGMVTRPMRTYPYSPANYDFTANSPGACMQACSASGYAYASVSDGRLCFCGSASTNTTLLNASTTSCAVLPCTGDGNSYCGALDYELVYTSVGVIDSASILLDSSTAATALMIDQTYYFSVGYQGAVNYISYLVDFGDGTATNWFNGALNVSTNISHVFSRTGQFSVSVAARPVAGVQPMMRALTVKVSDQIGAGDVSMTCPNVTATLTTVSCILSSVRGTGLTATFNYNSSDPTRSIISVPNAQYVTVGSPFVTNKPINDSSTSLLTSSDIAILPQGTINVTGQIGSIQFYSSGTGSATIYLLRPVCSGSQIYCYNSNQCGTCINTYAVQCSSGAYSTITHACVNANLSQRVQSSVYSGVSFQIVAQWSVSATAGVNQQVVTNTTTVVGDMLAFQSLIIAKEVSTDGTQDYRCVNAVISSGTMPCSVGLLSSNGTTFRYLLQATIIKGIQVAPDTMYNNVGLYSVSGTITQINVTSYPASANLLVIYGIEWIEVVGPSTASENVVVSFTANIYPVNATVSIYMWSINENNTFNSTTNTMNVSFSPIGTYNISCRAINPLSTRLNMTTIIVQDIISNFSLRAGNATNVSVSQPLEVAKFKLIMAAGSNYACVVNYDTSQLSTQVYYYDYGYIPGSYFTHQYLLPGQYNVFATCQNTVSNVSYSFIHYVQYPILGLQLQQHGTTQNTAFRLNFTIAQGTAPQFQILVNGTQVNYTYYSTYGLVQTTLFSGQSSSVNYSIEIYGWNYLSASTVYDVFSIVSLIVAPQIRASTASASFPGPIFFEYTMAGGSNMNVSFSFGDTISNNPVVCLFNGDYPTGANPTWSSCSGTNHTFQIPGTITVIAAFTNAVSTTYKYLTITLTTSVNPITVGTSLQIGSSQCAASFVENRAIASFIIRAANGSAKPASNAQVYIIPDTVNKPNVIEGPFQLTMNYFDSPADTSNGLNAIYSATGNYIATFLVSNSIDSTNISCNVTVASILQQVHYSITPLAWNLNSPTPLQASVYVFDTNPGAVTIIWNFGDGASNSTTRAAGTQATQATTQSHSYATNNTYNLTILAIGPLNTVAQSFPISVQYGVSAFTVNVSGPNGSVSQIAYSKSPVTVSIHVQDVSSPPATSAFLLVDYNDTSALATNSVINVSLPYSGTYTFQSPGIFAVNFTVYNSVSSITKIITVGINSPFNNYAMSICYLLPTYTSPLNDICNLSMSSSVSYLPKQSQLVIYLTWTNADGIPQAFDVIFKNSSTIVFKQTLTISQVSNISQLTGTTSTAALYRLVVDLEGNPLLKDGGYSLQVVTRNPSYSSSNSLNIYILSMVAGLTISDQNILVPKNVPKSFVAIYQNFSSQSCLYVTYSDGSAQCYGDNATCASLPTDVPSLAACPGTSLPFSYQNSSVSFTRTFNTSSASLIAYAWNRLTAITAISYLTFPLSTTDCGLPIILFNIYNPIIRWARRVPRSQAVSVSVQTTLNCSKSLNNTKQWNILQCNVATAKCSSTSALNQLVSGLSSSSTPEIYIPAQTLPYGTYLFNFSIIMSSQSSFAATSYTYLTIVPSAIQVNLLANGTSAITVGVAQSILFQPGIYSVDPDSVNFIANNWTYAYYCRVYGVGSYPLLNGAQLTIDSSIIDPANPSCFSSPGNTTNFRYGPNTNQSSVYIQPHALPSGNSYEFKVILTNIYDTTIQYTGYALVQVQEINAVLISVQCVIKMCMPNVEYQRINPTTQALVTSTCDQTCVNATQTIIQWNVYSGFQTGYPNNDMKWILYSNMIAYDSIFFYGRNTKNLTVTSAFFQNNPTVQYWQFEAIYTVTTATGVATGSGSIRFTINSPPSNGTCTVNQNNGTTMTPFLFTCSNWIDSDGIQDYSYYVSTSVNGTQIPIGFTTLQSLQIYLPAGDQSASYAVTVTVQIRDIYGAIATFTMPPITVSEDTATISDFIQLSQAASTQGTTKNALENILYSCDQNMASQLVLSLSHALNSMNANSTELATSVNIPATNLYVTGLLSSPSTGTTNASINTTAAMATYTASLNAEATVRDYAIQFMNNLSITTVDSIKLQASTMSALTDSTSALTRQAVTFAAAKCSNLVNALNAMVTTISSQDAAMAVESIASLAANVMEGPDISLLNRGIVINLDHDRANMFPVDYETDLESPWSNIRALSDGTDSSWGTIEKNRNLNDEQEASNQVTEQMNAALSEAVNVLSYHMNEGQTNNITTDSISMITTKITTQNLTSLTISPVSGAQIVLPAMSYCSVLFANNLCTSETAITTNTIVLPMAAAGMNGRTQVSINVSRSVSLTIYDTYGATLPVNNLSQPILLTIPRDSSLSLPPMTLQNITGQNTPTTTANNNRQFSLFYVNVTSPTASLTVSATFEFQSLDLSLAFLVIFRFDDIPILNSTMNNINGYQIFCPADQIFTDSDGDIYSYFLSNTQTVGHTYAMFGLRELTANETTIYCSNHTNSTVPITNQAVNFSSNYYIRAYTSGCYYLDSNGYWQAGGLVVSQETTHNQTQCSSYHLTTFAGGWIVLPAPINWNYVFANADFSKNKTIYLTIIILAVLYILIMIYARYKDKKDLEKLGVTPLPDNLANDKYYYQIVVFTGLRKDAGTTSKVHFVISGDDDETGVRTFEDPKRQILQRGGVDSFIMAVPKSLGRMNYMRIWHDNSGSGNKASWFLKYIVVRDLQTMEKNHFISQQWFAVEKEDGVVDRLVPVAGDEQKTEFSYLLSKKTYYSMSDGHLWFSVFSRPPSTRFTRTQRCTCCFVLLLMSMLMNIMYYDQAAEAKTNTAGGINLGPFRITPEQIGIGVIVELICFLPSTILVEMFRRLRHRRRRESPVRTALLRMQNEHQQKKQQAAVNDIHPHLTSYIVNADPILSRSDLDRMRNTLSSPLPGKQVSSEVYTDEPGEKKSKKPKTLPWWCIFVAYGLSFLVVTVSIFFIIARGIEFGDLKTQKWLTSSVSGFFSSILLTQPLKVVLLAIFFALILRHDEDDAIDHDSDDIFLDGDDEYLHAFDDGSLLQFRSKTGHIPLTQGEVSFARDQRLKEIKMWEIIRELLAYASFLWILYIVSYSNRDPNAYFMMQHLRENFLNLGNQTQDFTQIYRPDQYWNWLNATFIPALRATNWYNNDPPRNLTGFISDKATRILGWATMRQLRVKPDSCKILSSFQSIVSSCEASYSILNEDQQSFYPGWSSPYNSTLGSFTNYSTPINNAFMYNESDLLDSYSYVGEHATYGAGGYVYEFRGSLAGIISNITQLQQLGWIDRQTRAVIIQLSLYNPNVNLFAFTTILAEFIPVGQVYPSTRFEPLSLLNNYQGFALFKLICDILYMVFIIYYMQREIRSFLQRGMAYFRDFWSYPEIGIIACSWAGCGVYLWRIREANRIGDLFRETNGYAYVNLQLASYVNDVLTFLLGFCCFFGTIKFLRLLRFNHRMSLLSSTLSYAAKDLFSFTIMFSVIYLGYLALFYLLFNSKILECADPLRAAQMLFEMMLLKFDVSDLNAADAFLGPFCFTLFIIFVVFICMNMFISIIADSFRVVRHNAHLQNSEHEIVSFMLNQFKRWTGLGKTQEMDRLHTNPYDGLRVHYHDPITSFPEKMDELLVALNKIYMDTKRNDTVTFRPIAENISGVEGKLPPLSNNKEEK